MKKIGWAVLALALVSLTGCIIYERDYGPPRGYYYRRYDDPPRYPYRGYGYRGYRDHDD